MHNCYGYENRIHPQILCNACEFTGLFQPGCSGMLLEYAIFFISQYILKSIGQNMICLIPIQFMDIRQVSRAWERLINEMDPTWAQTVHSFLLAYGTNGLWYFSHKWGLAYTSENIEFTHVNNRRYVVVYGTYKFEGFFLFEVVNAWTLLAGYTFVCCFMWEKHVFV